MPVCSKFVVSVICSCIRSFRLYEGIYFRNGNGSSELERQSRSGEKPEGTIMGYHKQNYYNTYQQIGH
jgi:hypothetical protein